MAVPSNWTRVTVQGRFLNLDGTPMTGVVTFTPTAQVLLDAGASTIIAGTKWSVTLDDTGFFTVQLPATDDPDINPTSLTDVDNVTSFAYAVGEPTGRRYNLSVPSAAGTIDLVGVGATGTTATPPGAPTVGTATGGNGQATVTFTAPASNGGATITGYTVTSSPGGLTASGLLSPITVTGLTNGTPYTFTVRATNSAGTGAASAASNSVTPAGSGATVPGAPTIGTAIAGDASATVGFTAPASNGGSAITGYTATSTPGGLTGTGASSPLTVSGLTNGTAYTFKVKATNAVGTGADSGASNSVTPAAVPTSGGAGTTLRAYDSASPPTAAATDDSAVVVAVEFFVTKQAWISELRFWQPTTNSPSSAVRSGALWRVDSGSTGTNLSGTQTFPATVTGWNTLALSTPIELVPNQRYRAAVLHPAGRYAATANYFTSGAGATNLVEDYLTVPSNANAVANDQGSFVAGSVMDFPVDSFNGGNYWVDATVVDVQPVTHGQQLTVNSVGPWTLQGVSKGAESLGTPATPGRGYWLMDTPSEWAPTGTYVYNNNPTNKGGIVPAGGMTIDGYFIPAGTVVAQFRNYSAADFSAQGQAGSYLFRGCRFRNNAIGQSSQFNDFTATYTNRLFYCDIGSTSAADADWQGAFWKAIGGTGHIMLRNYCSYQYVTFQPNVPNCQFVENYVTDLIYYGGEAGPPGQEGDPLHMACIGSEGGGQGFRILRNYIVPASPDAGGHVFVNGSAIAFEGTNGSNYDDCQVKDNYLSGFNYVILDFGEVAGSTGIIVTGNKVTTRYFTNGGIAGVEQVGPNPPAWGSNGNVKSGNVWADDYGTGGNGTGTPLGSRQYPSGNGPRVGTTAF